MNHHRPHAEKDHRPLVGIVGLADHLANHIQYSHMLADYNPESSAAYQQLTPRWTEKYHVAFRWALEGHRRQFPRPDPLDAQELRRQEWAGSLTKLAMTRPVS